MLTECPSKANKYGFTDHLVHDILDIIILVRSIYIIYECGLGRAADKFITENYDAFSAIRAAVSKPTHADVY